jgi:hypothetical protein
MHFRRHIKLLHAVQDCISTITVVLVARAVKYSAAACKRVCHAQNIHHQHNTTQQAYGTSTPAPFDPRCCCVVLPAGPLQFPTGTGSLPPLVAATLPLLHPQQPLQQQLLRRRQSWRQRLRLRLQLRGRKGPYTDSLS